MKKFLVTTLMFGALGLFVPATEARAATAEVTADPQIRGRIYTQNRRRWNNRRPRSVITTRITRIGRYRYRETIRRTYLPGGRVRTVVLRRVRIGRAW